MESLYHPNVCFAQRQHIAKKNIMARTANVVLICLLVLFFEELAAMCIDTMAMISMNMDSISIWLVNSISSPPKNKKRGRSLSSFLLSTTYLSLGKSLSILSIALDTILGQLMV